jgi:hypothetical protein
VLEQFNFAGAGSEINLKSALYYYVLVTRHRVWSDNWSFWMLITRNYK